jgi:hypothetical protein
MLQELKDFLAFLTNLWGILAGVSVFFPLSNVLVEVVPCCAYGTDECVFDLVPPILITTVATIVTLFVVQVTFAGRDQFRRSNRRAMLRKAWLSLSAGVLSLLAYVATYRAYGEYAYGYFGLGSGVPRKMLFEIPLLVAYVVFFSLLTRAFMILGMIEFFGNRSTRDGD